MAGEIVIRKIEHGEVITEPGFYDMNIAWYHDNCCDGPSVSSSGLRTIELKTPLHYWDKSYLNPNRDPDATDTEELEADHFRIGRAGHMLMLEPQLFNRTIAVRPEKYDSWRTKESKEWLAHQQRAGKTILTQVELKRAQGVAATLQAHPWHSEGILGGLVETSMIARDPVTGIWLKSRPDSIPLDDAFADLKIMSDASPKAVDKSIRTLGYDMQMALSGVCMFLLTERTIDQNWIIACESSRPHAIHVAALSVQSVYWARIRLRHALEVMAKCLKDNYWPSYGADGQEVSPSDYDVKVWEKYQNGGLLPKDDGFVS